MTQTPERDCVVEKDNEQHAIEQNLSSYVLKVKVVLGKLNATLPSYSDGFIIRCLRVKNYNTEKAAILIKNFGMMMKMSGMQDLYAQFKPSELKNMYFRGTIIPILQRDSLGRLIVFARASSWNPTEFNFDQALAAIIVLINHAVAQSKELQSHGVVFVLDFSNWTFQQIRSIKLSRLQLVVKFMQNSSPMKIKGVHLIHYPKIVELIFMLVKSFLKAKLAHRIHFHSTEKTMLQFFDSQFVTETLPRIAACGDFNSNDSVVDQKILLDTLQSDRYCLGGQMSNEYKIWLDLDIHPIDDLCDANFRTSNYSKEEFIFANNF